MSQTHDPLALPDYYAVLGVTKDSTTAEIHARFRKVREAYECLSDPKKRGIYKIRCTADEEARLGKQVDKRTGQMHTGDEAKWADTNKYNAPQENETAAEEEKKSEAQRPRVHLIQERAVRAIREEMGEEMWKEMWERKHKAAGDGLREEILVADEREAEEALQGEQAQQEKADHQSPEEEPRSNDEHK